MRRFYGIDPEALATLLNDEDILDIESISIDSSHVKPMSTGITRFIGARPKILKPIKYTAFKKPEVIKSSTYKPTMSALVSCTSLLIM